MSSTTSSLRDSRKRQCPSTAILQAMRVVDTVQGFVVRGVGARAEHLSYVENEQAILLVNARGTLKEQLNVLTLYVQRRLM